MITPPVLSFPLYMLPVLLVLVPVANAADRLRIWWTHE